MVHHHSHHLEEPKVPHFLRNPTRYI
jgi:hypothetical protein